MKPPPLQLVKQARIILMVIGSLLSIYINLHKDVYLGGDRANQYGGSPIDRLLCSISHK